MFTSSIKCEISHTTSLSCSHGNEMYKTAWCSAKLLLFSNLNLSPFCRSRCCRRRRCLNSLLIACDHRAGLCKFIGTEEIVYIRKEFNSHRIGLEHNNMAAVTSCGLMGALQTQLSVGRFWSDWWVFNFGQIYNLEITLGTSKALFTLNTRKSEEKFTCYCKISSVLVLFFLKLNMVINRLCSAQLKSPSKTWNWEQKSL